LILFSLYINGSIGTQTEPEPLENNLELLTIALEHVWGLDSLPYHHKYPFDRLLIAQVQAEGMTLVSANGMFGMYEVELLTGKHDHTANELGSVKISSRYM
jgi:PIN domain nuclease of toxin-antitoxin system